MKHLFPARLNCTIKPGTIQLLFTDWFIERFYSNYIGYKATNRIMAENGKLEIMWIIAIVAFGWRGWEKWWNMCCISNLRRKRTWYLRNGSYNHWTSKIGRFISYLLGRINVSVLYSICWYINERAWKCHNLS